MASNSQNLNSGRLTGLYLSDILAATVWGTVRLTASLLATTTIFILDKVWPLAANLVLTPLVFLASSPFRGVALGLNFLSFMSYVVSSGLVRALRGDEEKWPRLTRRAKLLKLGSMKFQRTTKKTLAFIRNNFSWRSLEHGLTSLFEAGSTKFFKAGTKLPPWAAMIMTVLVPTLFFPLTTIAGALGHVATLGWLHDNLLVDLSKTLLQQTLTVEGLAMVGALSLAGISGKLAQWTVEKMGTKPATAKIIGFGAGAVVGAAAFAAILAFAPSVATGMALNLPSVGLAGAWLPLQTVGMMATAAVTTTAGLKLLGFAFFNALASAVPKLKIVMGPFYASCTERARMNWLGHKVGQWFDHVSELEATRRIVHNTSAVQSFFGRYFSVGGALSRVVPAAIACVVINPWLMPVVIPAVLAINKISFGKGLSASLGKTASHFVEELKFSHWVEREKKLRAMAGNLDAPVFIPNDLLQSYEKRMTEKAARQATAEEAKTRQTANTNQTPTLPSTTHSSHLMVAGGAFTTGAALPIAVSNLVPSVYHSSHHVVTPYIEAGLSHIEKFSGFTLPHLAEKISGIFVSPMAAGLVTGAALIAGTSLARYVLRSRFRGAAGQTTTRTDKSDEAIGALMTEGAATGIVTYGLYAFGVISPIGLGLAATAIAVNSLATFYRHGGFVSAVGAYESLSHSQQSITRMENVIPTANTNQEPGLPTTRAARLKRVLGL